MDRAFFNDTSPGVLVDTDGGELAFVPNTLPPPQWSVAATTWPLIAEAMHELGRLDGVTTSLPDPGILLRPLANREALRSSSLEGTYATPRELLLFDLPNAPTGTGDHVDSRREVSNYRRALTMSGETSVVDAPLHLIRQLHHVLLTNVRGSDRTPGAFRTRQVYIGADHRFVPPPPFNVPECLENLETFIKEKSSPLPPLVRAFLAHYQFETIHPFLDGNGRVGRLLMTIMIREFCHHKQPWLYLSAFFDRFKDEYIDKLFSVSTQNAWDDWINFCLRATITEARDTFDRCTKLLALREEYRAKVATRPRLSKIVDMLCVSPFARISSIASTLGVTYPTAKADIMVLVKLGVLNELPNHYPKTHYAPAIFRISFYEPDKGEPAVDK